MAHILECADAAFQWQSKSGKSQSLPHRATGDSFEGERVCGAGFAMDKLKQMFDESRKKVLTAAGAASTLNKRFWNAVDRTRLGAIQSPCKCAIQVDDIVCGC